MANAMHPLRAWRLKRRISLRSLVERLVGEDGEPLASIATMSRIENGRQDPSFRILEAVHALTGGAVTPNDFMRPQHPPTAAHTGISRAAGQGRQVAEGTGRA